MESLNLTRYPAASGDIPLSRREIPNYQLGYLYTDSYYRDRRNSKHIIFTHIPVFSSLKVVRNGKFDNGTPFTQAPEGSKWKKAVEWWLLEHPGSFFGREVDKYYETLESLRKEAREQVALIGDYVVEAEKEFKEKEKIRKQENKKVQRKNDIACLCTLIGLITIILVTAAIFTLIALAVRGRI